MYKYTLYCTEEQTKKALELGAPIECFPYYSIVKYEVRNFFVKEDVAYCYPTAEQMLGWLESKNIFCDVFPIETYGLITAFAYLIFECNRHLSDSKNAEFNSYKEATLAAIEAALEYLRSKQE